MSGLVYASSSNPGFAGLSSIYQYTNSDGINPKTVCGQAACATLLTYCKYMPAEIDTLRKIEKSHGPDLFGGALGTSPWRIESILKHYGCSARKHVDGLDGIKKYVASWWPVICIIQNTPGLNGLMDGAHWFVVFAYDDGGVYVTNYHPDTYLTWSDFDKKRGAFFADLASIGFRAITNTAFKPPSYIKSLPRRPPLMRHR